MLDARSKVRMKAKEQVPSLHILVFTSTQLLEGSDLTTKVPLSAGKEIRLSIDLQEYDRLNEFENAVLNQLPSIGDSSTFGCELQFVHKGTHKVLADPIWNTLRDNHCFNVIARQCFVDALHKGHLKGGAKAIRVPSSTTDRILPQAFSLHTEVRHVQVEAGIRVAGEAAWRSCQRLQAVHLPSTVVCLQHGAFRRCYLLRAVLAPGCRQFGIKVFEACCSLTQIGATSHTTNQLAPQAQLRPRAFEKCAALRHLSLERTEHNPTNPERSLPECCFLEAGIVSLSLPPDFTWVGPAACERCKRLQIVDLSRADIVEILGSTFAHCSQLQTLNLSSKLRRIEQEAFLHCASLREVYIPVTLLYIARRAFAGCAQLRTFCKAGKSTTWRGTYARVNAFDKCDLFEKPLWLRFLPPNAKDSWREDFIEAVR